MTFTKRLREGIRRGEITCSVRIWTCPHVRIGARYRMEEGEIQVDSIQPIGFPDITPELARESGFLGVLDLLKVAKHGRGENIYLIRFHYVRPRALSELMDLCVLRLCSDEDGNIRIRIFLLREEILMGRPWRFRPALRTRGRGRDAPVHR